MISIPQEKRQRKRVVVTLPDETAEVERPQKQEEEEGEEREEGEEGEEGSLGSRRRRAPMRSQTVCYRPHEYGSPFSEGAKEIRRQSISLIRQGHTGEKGSLRFRAALRRDASHEIHPGWESIRRLGRVVG